MNPPSIFPVRSRPASPGVAMVVTLLMMSVLVMMVVGLAGVMRNEQAAGRNLTYQVLADQLAEVGAREAMAAVFSNSTNGIGRASVTGPGWMQQNGVFTLLAPAAGTAGSKNLEEVGTNSLILGLPDNARSAIRAGWVQVVPAGGSPSIPVGRYTWWVDDEGTKVNLNAVGSTNTSYLGLLTNLPFSADYLFLDPATGASNAASSAWATAVRGRRQAFLTPESLKDTNVTGLTGAQGTNPLVYRRAKGHVTAWSSNVDLTPWGSQKLNLTDSSLTTNQIRAALATNALTNFFNQDMSLARKYGGGALSSTNAGNHGDLVLSQIAANVKAAQGNPIQLTVRNYQANFANDNALRHRNGMPLLVDSLRPEPCLEEVRVRVDFSVSGNTVISRIGFLVVVVNPYNQAFANYSLKVQPRKFRFNVQFIDNTGANVLSTASSAPLNGFVGPVYSGNVWAGPEWFAPTFQPWPLASFFVSNNITFPPRSRSEHIFSSTITLNLDRPPTGVPAAYVILDQVGLFANGTPTVTSLRDWLTADDLSQAGNFTSAETGQMSFNGTGGNPSPISAGANLPPLSAASFGAGTSMGVRKIDPQVRFPLPYWNTIGTTVGQLRTGGWPQTAQAWSRTVTLAQSMTNRLLSYLPTDPAPGVTDILDHPHFVDGYRTTNGIRSVAQLGAIHTGIPWRTLRLQPMSGQERTGGAGNSFPPDWIVVDLFTATNPTASLGMVNVNGIAFDLAGAVTNAPVRRFSLLSAMGTAASAASSQATNGVPVSLTAAGSAYTNLPQMGNNVATALTNPSSPASWSTNSVWSAARSGRPAFPSQGMALRGEILEVPGVAEDATLGEDVIEGRLRAFLDLVTTRSDTFSVWSVGQGLAVNTNASPPRSNVMGEVVRQTVFQRVPQFGPTGALTGYQVRVLYTRNHLLE